MRTCQGGQGGPGPPSRVPRPPLALNKNFRFLAPPLDTTNLACLRPFYQRNTLVYNSHKYVIALGFRLIYPRLASVFSFSQSLLYITVRLHLF